MSIRYFFQESRIWEGNNDIPCDSGRKITVKLPSEDDAKARRKLPPADIGRYWLLMSKESS